MPEYYYPVFAAFYTGIRSSTLLRPCFRFCIKITGTVADFADLVEKAYL